MKTPPKTLLVFRLPALASEPRPAIFCSQVLVSIEPNKSPRASSCGPPPGLGNAIVTEKRIVSQYRPIRTFELTRHRNQRPASPEAVRYHRNFIIRKMVSMRAGLVPVLRVFHESSLRPARLLFANLSVMLFSIDPPFPPALVRCGPDRGCLLAQAAYSIPSFQAGRFWS